MGGIWACSERFRRPAHGQPWAFGCSGPKSNTACSGRLASTDQLNSSALNALLDENDKYQQQQQPIVAFASAQTGKRQTYFGNGF